MHFKNNLPVAKLHTLIALFACCKESQSHALKYMQYRDLQTEYMEEHLSNKI